MIIQNKKNGIAHEISREGWDKLKSIHMDKLYKVIESDDKPSKVTTINVPKQITDLQERIKELVIKRAEEPEKKEIPIPPIEEIKPKKPTAKRKPKK